MIFGRLVSHVRGAVLLALLLPGFYAQADEQDPHDEHHADDHEVEEIVVQATRSRRRVQDEAIRVELLSQEEIEEKLLMRPGNISMLLAKPV